MNETYCVADRKMCFDVGKITQLPFFFILNYRWRNSLLTRIKRTRGVYAAQKNTHKERETR